MNVREAVVVAYGRSPMCRARKGGFATMHPVDYAGLTLKGVLEQVPQLPAEKIDDVVVGCAMPQHRAGMNIARLIALRAGMPITTPAQTVNRFCSSGLQTIATAANAIMAGQMDCVVAGGVEDMSQSGGTTFDPNVFDPWLQENIPGAYFSMGETAEQVVDKYSISRERMEQMAVESHAKAAKAREEGKFATSIIPIVNDKGETITEDEGIRPGTTAEALAQLKPAFRENGSVTAAVSSQTTDGAAFVVIMSREMATELGLTPIARFVSFAVAGCDPKVMGIGPIYAVPKVMEKAGMTVNDMDVIELNEAFASQALACIDELKLPYDKVNPYGGAMALGHPMGATGAFLLSKALDYLKDNGGKNALVTMCIGGGQGAAGIFELL